MPHCKDTIPKIRNKYSQNRNCAAIPLTSLSFFCRTIGGPNVGIYRSLTYIWMWKLGLRPRNYFSGNYKFKFLCSACAVKSVLEPVYRSLWRDQSYWHPFLYFKSEIISFWIWALERNAKFHYLTVCVYQLTEAGRMRNAGLGLWLKPSSLHVWVGLKVYFFVSTLVLNLHLHFFCKE